jgi:hypothetical protein
MHCSVRNLPNLRKSEKEGTTDCIKRGKLLDATSTPHRLRLTNHARVCGTQPNAEGRLPTYAKHWLPPKRSELLTRIRSNMSCSKTIKQITLASTRFSHTAATDWEKKSLLLNEVAVRAYEKASK